MQINKKYIPIAIAGALGLIATMLINTYITQQADEAKKRAAASQKNIVTVIVARQDISAGTVISEKMISEESVQKDRLQPRAATASERVLDKIAIAPISKGEQILLNKLTMSGMDTSLAMKIPKGKRAITIPVDKISSVGGMIRPGDHVDLMGMVPIPAMGLDGKQTVQMSTMPLFQDVLILAVGEEFSNVSGGKSSEKMIPAVTLALTPQEANLVAFVQEQGKIRLILRSPEDTQVQPAVPASWDTLFMTVMPQLFQKQEEKPVMRQRKVEIIRGLSKEEKVLE